LTQRTSGDAPCYNATGAAHLWLLSVHNALPSAPITL